MNLQLKLKLVTASPGGRVVGWLMVGDGWTKTKLMLYSTQVEVVVKVEVELGNFYLVRDY